LTKSFFVLPKTLFFIGVVWLKSDFGFFRKLIKFHKPNKNT
jgi:hypothetical protein